MRRVSPNRLVSGTKHYYWNEKAAVSQNAGPTSLFDRAANEGRWVEGREKRSL
jgi:hypothetical protein